LVDLLDQRGAEAAMSKDHFAECPNCGKLYPVVEGHDCEYGTYIPPRESIRVTVQDDEGNDVEISVDHA